ncbi:hypothetical protein AAFC00_001434 [Neodothiora populina]|uniref:Rab proteins geranylgeranyltransferase n=1 Tax=Neodothiora populina TaxID=2781224 RepID=A0ABR3PP29_9PEZI
MDTLEGTDWDILISGTGIQQSLLALALSRSGKKVLHIDKNDVYGGSEAALSLDEAEQFAEIVNSANSRSPFSNASYHRPDVVGKASVGSSRSYNLSLAPTLLYTRSALLPVLVSSRAHQQLEFQAVGSWFVYDRGGSRERGADAAVDEEQQRLLRVPNGREDIFADESLSLKSKGSLMKFIRFVAAYEERPEIWETNQDTPFPDFLVQQFNLPVASHGPLLALTLSPNMPQNTTTGFAVPKIARHLRSIGMFGPGFGAVIPKWGGLSELAQVACRACAVGGAVYVLGKGIESIEDRDVEEVPRPQMDQEDISQEVSDAIGANEFVPTNEESLETLETEIKEQSLEQLLAEAGYSIDSEDAGQPTETAAAPQETSKPAEPQRQFYIRLDGGDTVKADFVVGTDDDLPIASSEHPGEAATLTESSVISRCISIVSADLPSLFPVTAEGGVTPAGAVVVFPSSSLDADSITTPPVHVVAHTSDTGECPKGQCILYASIALTGDKAFELLQKAIKKLIATQGSDVKVLWTLQYQQSSNFHSPNVADEANGNILRFPNAPLDLAFNDSVLDNVKQTWLRIVGGNGDEFMKFEDREAAAEDDAEDDM